MTGRQDLFEESMRLGHSAAWDLDWDQATGYYQKALAEFPENPDALNALGLALLETNKHREALGVYFRAAKAAPEDPVPREKCAEIFETLGQAKDALESREAVAELYSRRRDVEKAVANWGHMARLAPDNLAVRSRLALTYERLGRRRQAVEEYIAISSILQKAGKTERATEAAQRALGLIPADPEAGNALRMLREGRPLPPPGPPRPATSPLRPAEVKGFLEKDTQSQVEAERSLDDPETAAQRQALSYLAGALFDEPKEAPAAASKGALKKGKAEPSDRKALGRPQMYRSLSAAIDLQSHGSGSQAAKEYERAIEAGLDHPTVHYNLGLLYKDQGEPEKARKHLMAALGHPDLDMGANLSLGRIARTEGDQAEAARFLLQALRRADSLSVAEGQSPQLEEMYDAMQASLNADDPEGLRKIVENTLAFLTGPGWLSNVRRARATVDGDTDVGKVKTIADWLVTGGTEQVVRALDRIEQLMAEGHYLSAMEEAFLALHFAPNYLSLHSRMADILMTTNRTEAAVEKLQVIAATHRVRGENRQAADVYAKILEYSPVDISLRTHLIDLLAQQDRVDEAVDQYLQLVDLYRQMAELDQARATLEQALSLTQRGTVSRQKQLNILHRMADIDLSRLDSRGALRVYAQVRKLDPNDEKARRESVDLNLRLGQEEQAAKELDGYLEFLVQNGRGTEALALLEEMAREHPGKQALHARLAEAYRAAGRSADALAQYDALGEIQLDAGSVREAARTIQIIISLNPPDVEGYKELLRNLEAGQ